MFLNGLQLLVGASAGVMGGKGTKWAGRLLAKKKGRKRRGKQGSFWEQGADGTQTRLLICWWYPQPGFPEHLQCSTADAETWVTATQKQSTQNSHTQKASNDFFFFKQRSHFGKRSNCKFGRREERAELRRVLERAKCCTFFHPVGREL